MPAEYQLIFTLDLKQSGNLLWGNLKLIYPDKTEIDYLATSGATGWQAPEHQWMRARGPIPSGFDYKIATKPYYLPTKGVEGLFFHITPDPVRSPKGTVRGEFGIHFDANVPGSAGCVVLRNRSGFEAFCDRMKRILDEGIESIPLKISYS